MTDESASRNAKKQAPGDGILGRNEPADEPVNDSANEPANEPGKAASESLVTEVTAAVRSHWEDLDRRLASETPGEDGWALGRARVTALDALLTKLFDAA